VRQLVRQQPRAARRARAVLAGTEHDVVSERERARASARAEPAAALPVWTRTSPRPAPIRAWKKARAGGSSGSNA